MTRKSDLFTLQAGLTADSRQNYEGQDWLEAEQGESISKAIDNWPIL
ncbi:MAG: hypothetical protein ACKPBT_07805 [Microcystis aeruginosa]